MSRDLQTEHMTDSYQAKTGITGKFRTRLTGLTMYNLTTEIRKVGMAGSYKGYKLMWIAILYHSRLAI